MRHLVVLFIHLIAILTELLQPGGVRSLVAELLLLKHQLLIANRSRQRRPWPPNLSETHPGYGIRSTSAELPRNRSLVPNRDALPQSFPTTRCVPKVRLSSLSQGMSGKIGPRNNSPDTGPNQLKLECLVSPV
jgi:hypothetical protein